MKPLTKRVLKPLMKRVLKPLFRSPSVATRDAASPCIPRVAARFCFRCSEASYEAAHEASHDAAHEASHDAAVSISIGRYQRRGERIPGSSTPPVTSSFMAACLEGRLLV
jgi:hypothetical protein